jgi:hypothetical protein
MIASAIVVRPGARLARFSPQVDRSSIGTATGSVSFNSSHIAFKMENVPAKPTPNIQEKYHMIRDPRQ